MPAPRLDGRRADALRPITITPNYLKDPEGSALIRAGSTWVLCTATVEEKVPNWMRDSGKGWVTAEYAMLPRATPTRSGRAPSGRAKEIERLVGRSLRAAVDMGRLGPRTITIDCDVLQADGGTRTAAITGGWVALAIACRKLALRKGIKDPIVDHVAAISVGIIDGEARLDLPYDEDARAEVDMNVVMNGAGRFIELQGTGEQGTFDQAQLGALVALASAGVQEIVQAQKAALAEAFR